MFETISFLEISHLGIHPRFNAGSDANLLSCLAHVHIESQNEQDMRPDDFVLNAAL